MSNEITQILNRISAGESHAVDELVPLVYDQMRKIATAASNREGVPACDPTELVHEAYIRLVGNEKLAWQSRSHFFGACAAVIRRVLVDQARARDRTKRGGEFARVELNEHLLAESQSVDLVDLDEALAELAKLAPRQVRLIELRYFGGLSETGAAELLQVSRRTVSGDWAMAKAWLRTRLS
ncbi:ECF-type sigma factor [Planctomycetaceae bacterium SH139]